MTGLRASGFKLWFKELDLRLPNGSRAIFAGLEDFREHLGGELTVTYPKGIGARHEVHEVEISEMEQAFLAFRQAFG
jgi:3-dehydroquinate synthase